MKKFRIFFLFVLCHFGLSVLIVPITMLVSGTSMLAQPGPSLAIQLLVTLTSILHFPIITLSLYPRMLFPGSWIYIPIAINSVVVAVGLFFLVALIRKVFNRQE